MKCAVFYSQSALMANPYGGNKKVYVHLTLYPNPD